MKKKAVDALGKLCPPEVIYPDVIEEIAKGMMSDWDKLQREVLLNAVTKVLTAQMDENRRR